MLPGIRKHIVVQQNPPSKEIYVKMPLYKAPIKDDKLKVTRVNTIFLTVSTSSFPNIKWNSEHLKELKLDGIKKNNSKIIDIFAMFINISFSKIDSLNIIKSSDFKGVVKKLDIYIKKYIH